MKFLLLLILPFYLWGAAPVTHAYLAEMYLKHFPYATQEEHDAFIVGTEFPDIRYLAKIPRKKTHPTFPTLMQIRDEPSAFHAGFLFHNYVDEVREGYVRKHGVCSNIKHMPHKVNYLKLLEDEYLFEKKNWLPVRQALLRTHPEELHWNIPQKTINRWHIYLDTIFQEKPYSLISLYALTGKSLFGVKSGDLWKWQASFHEHLQSDWMDTYMKGLLFHFEILFQNKS